MAAATPGNLPYLREQQIYDLIEVAPARDPQEILPVLCYQDQRALRQIYKITIQLSKEDATGAARKGYKDYCYLPYVAEFTLPDARVGNIFVKLKRLSRGSYNSVYILDIGAFNFKFTDDDVWNVEAVAKYHIILRRPLRDHGSTQFPYSYDNDFGLRTYITKNIPDTRVPKVFDYGCFPDEDGNNYYMLEEYVPSKDLFRQWFKMSEREQDQILERIAESFVGLMMDNTTSTITTTDELRPFSDAIGGINWDFENDTPILGKLCNLVDIGWPASRELIEGPVFQLKSRSEEDKRRGIRRLVNIMEGYRGLADWSTLPPDDPSLPYNPGPYPDYVAYGLAGLSRELIYHRTLYRKQRQLSPGKIPTIMGLKYKRFIYLLDVHVRGKLESYRTDPSYTIKYNHTAITHRDFHSSNVMLAEEKNENGKDIVYIDWDMNGLYPIHYQFPKDRFDNLFCWEKHAREISAETLKAAIKENRKFSYILKAKIKRIYEERGMSKRKIHQAFGKNALGPYGDPFVELVTNMGVTTPDKYFDAVYWDDRKWRKTFVQKGLGYFWFAVYRLEYELKEVSEHWRPLLVIFALLLFLTLTSIIHWSYWLLFIASLLYIIQSTATPIAPKTTVDIAGEETSQLLDDNCSTKVLNSMWIILIPLLFELILSSEPISVYSLPNAPLFPEGWSSGVLRAISILVCLWNLFFAGALTWISSKGWGIGIWCFRKLRGLIWNQSRIEWSYVGMIGALACVGWWWFTGVFPWGLMAVASYFAAFWGVVCIIWSVAEYGLHRLFGMRIHPYTGRVVDGGEAEIGSTF